MAFRRRRRNVRFRRRRPMFRRRTRFRRRNMRRRSLFKGRRALARFNRRQPRLIPDTYVIRSLRYNTVFTIDPGAGIMGHHVFRLNSTFDPDWTGVGHQPFGRDQMFLLYTYSRVVKTYYKVTMCDPIPSSGLIWGTQVNETSQITPSNTIVSAILEGGNTRHAFVQVNADGTVERGPTTMSGQLDSRKLLRSNSLWSDDWTETNAGGPTSNTYLKVIVGPSDQATNYGPSTFSITLVYTCMFFHPNSIAQS